MTTRLKTHLQITETRQCDLASRVRTTPDTISRLARWNLGSDNLRRRVAEALGVPAKELFPELEDE
jgi:transcriptional regulator with XRE-family HTH domain